MAEIQRKIRIRGPLQVNLGAVGTGPLLEMLSGARDFFVGIREGTLLDLVRDPRAVLKQTQLDEVTAGVDFDDKENLVEVADGFELQYFVNAGTQGKLTLWRSGTKIDGRRIPEGEVLSSFELAAEFDAGVAVPIVLPHGITLSPGVRGGASIEVQNVRRHAETDPALHIVERAIGEFRFPFNPRRVEELREGEFIRYRFEGSLAITTRASWGFTTNVLFDQLDDLKQFHSTEEGRNKFWNRFDLKGKLAAETAVEFVHGFTDEFDFKVEKKAGTLANLFISRAAERQTEVGFNFSTGLGLETGPQLRLEISRLLARRLGGLSQERIDSLAQGTLDAMEEALMQRARIEFSTAYREVDRDGVLFQFEFNLAQEAARDAYRKAAEGDLTEALAAAEKSASGVKLLRTITERVSRQKLEVTLNLLGLFRFQSVEELLQKSIVEVDEAGEVSIYHQNSFQAKSRTSLGHLKVADFLFKATWNRSQDGQANEKDFNFTLRYIFREKDRFTSRQELVDVLSLAVALGELEESRKQEILSVPVEFRRALTWPVLGLLSPAATYGRSAVIIESSFSEAGLESTLKHEDQAVWSAYIRAYGVVNPRSPVSDWIDPRVRTRIDKEGWASYVNVADTSLRMHRHGVVTEYQKAKQFVMTLRVFREAVRSGKKGNELIPLMRRAAKAARSFHFDKTAFVALHFLADEKGRKTRIVIEGEKINAAFGSEIKEKSSERLGRVS